MLLTGRTAIVTGAGSGIGRALAHALAGAGMQVACAGRHADSLDETVAAITDAGGSAFPVVVDVTERVSVASMVASVLERSASIDLLFNNAGSFGAVGPVWDADIDAWWHDVTVNLLGTFMCTHAVLPAMRAQGSGVVINMDGGGGAGGPNLGGSAYGSSKAAIVRFSEGLARELERDGSDILVFTMFPGLVRTVMTEGLIATEPGLDWQAFVQEAFQRGESRSAADCAAATLRLLAIAGPELSGCSFDVDTDYDEVDRRRAEIARDRLLTMRLRPLG